MNARITCKLVTFLCVLPQRLVINDNLLTMSYKIIFYFYLYNPPDDATNLPQGDTAPNELFICLVSMVSKTSPVQHNECF